MSLNRGDQLGPYELLERIGAGGMGEVYRARDPRLQRIVAIKILKGTLEADAERRKRFLQEARAASALNHPHIVSVFDIGTAGGCTFLVMEYLPGKPLDKIIPPKGQSIAQAIGYAADIADALAAAHSAGIVHRDIKPGNVIVGPDEQLKVLDFGLAKLIEPTPGEYSETKTQESALTRPGTIVGTSAYMSPEQAAGHPVDHRTDIFSLGIVLYEMIAGQRPFQGKSPAELLNAIIHAQPPPVTERNPALPIELEDVLAKALAKDPRKRYQHAGDLALDLRRLQSGLETRQLPSLRAVRSAPVRLRGWMLPIAAALALIVGAVAWRLRQLDTFWTNPMTEARITRLTDFEGDELDAAISQDGKVVAFLSDRDGPFDAWVAQVGSGNFVNLTKGQFPALLDELAFGIGFSGDGTRLWVRGETGTSKTAGISTVPVFGGSARRFLDAAFNVAWSPDGARIVYATGGNNGDSIFLAEPDGTGAKRIFATKSDEHSHYPVWSPDGRYIYFIYGGVRLAQADVWRVPSGGGKAEQITHHHGAVRYPALLDERTVVYIAPAADGSGTSLYGMDVERRVPHRLNVGVEQYRSVASGMAKVGGHPRLVAAVANPSSHVWSVPVTPGIALEKDASQLTLPSVRATSPRAGPGYLLYLSSTGGDAGIWKFQDGAGLELWKPADGAAVSTPAVSSDGRQLCFIARRNGRGTVYLMSVDGTNRKALCEGIDVQDDPSWSPDGQWLAVAGNDGKGSKLFKVKTTDGTTVSLIEAAAHYPLWSPDGRFIIYRRTDKTSIEAVTPEGVAFPIGLPPLPFRNAVRHPYRFLPDRRQIVVLSGQYRQENFLLADLHTGQSRQLTNFKPGFSITSFDISPDGKRILFDRVRDNADIVIIEPKQ